MADYLGCSIQAAIATESAASGDEDHHNSGDLPENEACHDLDENDDGDDDGDDEEQGGLDPSDYI